MLLQVVVEAPDLTSGKKVKKHYFDIKTIVNSPYIKVKKADNKMACCQIMQKNPFCKEFGAN